MAEFLELVDTLRAEEASIQTLFGNEGTGVRHSKLKEAANYKRMLVEAAELVQKVVKGRLPTHYLTEALSTDDFPLLFGDILDRQLLGAFRDFPKNWQNFTRQRTVRDFRQVKRFQIDGAEGVLSVVGEQELYPGSTLSEAQFVYAVQKRGRYMPFSWETIINDDLDALQDVPQRFGKAAARSEAKFVTELYVDASGPHASLYTGGNGNIIASNPVFDLAGIAAGLTLLDSAVDEDGEPIIIEAVELVVPPALRVTAMNIMNAIQVELTTLGGTRDDNAGGLRMIGANWMKTNLRLTVDPYIPIVASSANGSTSWFLFAGDAEGRFALEFGRLRGHEEPEIFIREPNARRIGGGTINPLEGDFDRDGISYKVRHVFGGTRLEPKVTVASNGSGS